MKNLPKINTRVRLYKSAEINDGKVILISDCLPQVENVQYTKLCERQMRKQYIKQLNVLKKNSDLLFSIYSESPKL